MGIGLFFKKLEGALEKGERHEDAPHELTPRAVAEILAFWVVFALQIWAVLQLVIWLCSPTSPA